MKKTSNDCKAIAQAALRVEYGFKPALNDIKIISHNGIGTKIYFAVGKHEYKFNSYIETCGDMRTVRLYEGAITNLS